MNANPLWNQIQGNWIGVIQDDGQGVVTEVATVDGELAETGAEVLDKGRGAVVHQHV